MKLIRARVTAFKSIDDSGWVDFDDVTCLVGKNESGKTAFLQALYKLSPVEATSGAFDVVRDYPRKAYSRYSRSHDEKPVQVVEAQYKLSPSEMAQIIEAYGQGVMTNDVVAFHKYYDNQRRWTVPVDEAKFVEATLTSASLPADAKAQLKKAKTRSELAHSPKPRRHQAYCRRATPIGR